MIHTTIKEVLWIVIFQVGDQVIDSEVLFLKRIYLNQVIGRRR